jgi:hypothetical protein
MSDTSQANTEYEWLVMLYIASDDKPSDYSISQHVEDMKRRLGDEEKLPYDPRVQVVLFYDRDIKAGKTASIEIKVKENGSSRLISITADARNESEQLKSAIHDDLEADSGNWQTLSAFITWAMNRYKPSTHTMLAVIGHGAGLRTEITPSEDTTIAIGSNTVASDKTGGPGGGSPSLIGLCPDYNGLDGEPSYMRTEHLRQAIEAAPRAIDVLFLDACFMGMFEIAYEIRKCTKYIITGQNILYAGLPYEQYIAALTPGPNDNAVLKPEAIATKIVEIYNKDYYNLAWTITAIASQHIESAAEHIDKIAEILCETIPMDDAFIDKLHIEGLSVRARIHAAYAAAQKFDADNDRQIDPFAESYVDLFDFFYSLSEQFALAVKEAGSNKQYQDLASKLGDANKRIEQLIRLIGESSRHTTFVRGGSKEPMPYVPRKRLPSATSQNPGKLILSTHSQNDKNDRTCVLASAYGLSIYLPLGKPPRTLRYYQDPHLLQFAGGVSNWWKLIAVLLGFSTVFSPETQSDPFLNAKPDDYYLMRQGIV